MEKAIPKLTVYVQREGNLNIAKASLSAISQQEDIDPIYASFDQEMNAFVFGALKPGSYRLVLIIGEDILLKSKVKISGYAQKLWLAIPKQNEINLRQGGGSKVFELNKDEIGVVYPVRIPEVKEKEKEERGKKSAPDKEESLLLQKFARQSVVPPFEKIKKEKGINFLKTGRKSVEKEGIISGALVRDAEGRESIVTGNVFVGVADGVNDEMLQNLLPEFDVKKGPVNSLTPNLYLLRWKGENDASFLEAVQKLEDHREIEFAEPELYSGGAALTQIFPADPLLNGQYYLVQMGVPEAWQILHDNGGNDFGSADVIICVEDTGIETTGGGTAITHPDFNGPVTGGTLSTQVPVPVPNTKVYFSFDSRTTGAAGSLMAVGNDAIVPDAAGNAEPHGAQVAGVIAALRNGVGVAGIAGNARLMSIIAPWQPLVAGGGNTAAPAPRWAEALFHQFGFDPEWTTGPYAAGQQFPRNFKTPGLITVYNPSATLNSPYGPGASIKNQSYKDPATFATPPMKLVYRWFVRIGRNRRGGISIATSANGDQSFRGTTSFGPANYTLIIGASTLDHLGRETLAAYSNFAIDYCPGIDFVAPSNSDVGAIPTPPLSKHVLTTTRTASGNTTDNVAFTAVLTAVCVSGSTTVNASIPGADFVPIGWCILRRSSNRNIAEVVLYSGVGAPGVYNLAYPVLNQYNIGDELLFLSGPPPPLNHDHFFGGTSAAAPMVSGVVALMLTANKNLTWLDVRKILQVTSVPIAIGHRGPRPAKITNATNYTDSAGFVISATDLNWIEFTAGNFGSIGPGTFNPLLLPTGLLDTNAHASVISTGAPSYPSNNNNYPQWKINVGAGAPAFQIRQAILIGAETTLSASVLDPTANPHQDFIEVNNAAGFAVGNSIRIGRYAETILQYTDGLTLDVPALTATYTGPNLDVISTDGFQIGDRIDILLTGGIQTRTITGFGGIGHSGNGIEGGKSRIILNDNITMVQADTGVLVRTASTGTETATILAIAGNRITIDNSNADNHVNNPYNHVNNIPVRLVKTEYRVIKSITVNAGQTILEVDRLEHTHTTPVRVTPGRVADYSFMFGYGRIDAAAAVRASLQYFNDPANPATPRPPGIPGYPDLMIRKKLADSGIATVALTDIQSPDIWVRNADDMAANPLAQNAEGPHQRLQTHYSWVGYEGNAGNNNLMVAGIYTGAAPSTFVITTDGAGNFSWAKDGGAASIVAIVAESNQALSDGVEVVFQNTAYDGTEKWTFTAQPATNFVFVRVLNRGGADAFIPNQIIGGGAGLPDDYYAVRAFIQMTDGSPVPRFDGVGLDDLTVKGTFTGAGHSEFRITIDATGAPDTFSWQLDNGAVTAGVPIGVSNLLTAGITIVFKSTTGHTAGDFWLLKARPNTNNQPFKTLDDYILIDPSLRPFDVRKERAGTRRLGEKPIIASIAPAPTFPAGADRIYSYSLPNTDLPILRSAFSPRPANPLRMFLLGEVVPHDGPEIPGSANYLLPASTNNLSYREVAVVKFKYLDETGAAFPTFVEVDAAGTVNNRAVTVQIVAETVSIKSESLKFELVMETISGGVENKILYYNAGVWEFQGGNPSWATPNNPTIGTSATVATGDQYQLRFKIDIAVSNAHKKLKIKTKVQSAVTAGLTLEEDTFTLPIYEQSALPSNRYKSKANTDLIPRSFFFAVPNTLVQAQEHAYGPVFDAGDATIAEKRYRVTSLFRSPTDVKAYAVVGGFVMIQRNATNPNLVNLFLKPFAQPITGLTPVKYFVYRGLTLTHFLKGTSATDEIELRDQAGSSDFMTQVWATYLNQNAGAVTIPGTVLGWDPAAAGTTLVDSLFFRENANLQLPFVGKGVHLGDFYADSGNQDFGIEVILEEGEFQPDLDYAKKTSHEIDITLPIAGTETQALKEKLEREKILNYMDPAAFYGLHLSEGGVLQVNDGAGNVSTPNPVDLFNNVLAKFFTKNALYVDIRNEQGNSLNFSGKYDDGTANHVALEIGDSAAGLAGQKYETSKWPILIINKTGVVNANPFNEMHLRLRLDYNHIPVLYVEHGKLLSAVPNPRFVAGTNLVATPGDPKTKVIGFRFPNRDAGAGKKDNVPWLIKLQYCLRIAAANTPFPPEVLPQSLLTDNLFGPVDINPVWGTGHTLKWQAAQDKKFVDGAAALFSYVAERGVAFEGSGATERVIFFAAAKDYLQVLGDTFAMNKGLTGGTSSEADFFSESSNLNGYHLVYDQAVEGTARFTMLYFSTDPDAPQPIYGLLVAGFTKAQFDTLKALPGLSTKYPRNIALTEEAGSPFTVDGKTYRKFKAGLRGLKDNATADTIFPATDIFVYSVDGFFYFTKDFSAAQALPTVYSRNYEEAIGAIVKQPRHYPIRAAVLGPKYFVIEGIDLRRYIRANDVVTVKNSSTNDKNYTVNSVQLDGTDTRVLVNEVIPNNIHALGDLFEPSRTYEDYFIGLDQDGVIAGTNPMKTIVDAFIAAVTAIPDNAGAKAAIQAQIDTAAPQILERGRKLTRNNSYAYADDRPLYWARIKMIVAIKSHPAMLKSISERDELVKRMEVRSRGLNNAGFAAAGTSKKLLISGFDPFMLNPFNTDHNAMQSNPSGAVALALHGQTITTGAGVNIYIQAGIFPVRYRDFDQNNGLGVVEDFFQPFMNAGSNKADVIMTMSQGSDFRFDIDKYASRNRGGYIDNENRPSPPYNPQFKFPSTAVGNEFYLTTLPVAKLASVTTGHGFDIGENIDFAYYFMNGAARNDVDNSTAGGITPDNLSPATNPKIGDIKSVSGSGGDYLSNEIFYRVARLRSTIDPNQPTGHYHIPKIQSQAESIDNGDRLTVDFDATNMNALIQEVIESIKRMFS